MARRGYAVRTAVLEAILPPGDGPTATAPITTGDEGLQLLDGVEAKSVIVDQLAQALEVIEQHAPARIVTLGVSAPSASPPAPGWRTATAMIWRSCGSTPTSTWTPSTTTRSCSGWVPYQTA